MEELYQHLKATYGDVGFTTYATLRCSCVRPLPKHPYELSIVSSKPKEIYFGVLFGTNSSGSRRTISYATLFLTSASLALPGTCGACDLRPKTKNSKKRPRRRKENQSKMAFLGHSQRQLQSLMPLILFLE